VGGGTVTRPRLLDLFCGAGGAAMGYHRAGFDVVGVDIRPQPRYPFGFIQEDAVALLGIITGLGCYDGWALEDFAAIHASPPCQAFSSITATRGDPGAHPDLLAPTRELLLRSGLPWIIENVPGAPMRPDLKLCGCMFGLAVQRERWFETSWRAFDLRPPCHHAARAVGVYGYGGVRPSSGRLSGRLNRWRAAMGIDWMEVLELAQAIPPAYTEHIGRMLMDALANAA
jgi:DNA (cytosine-5)-methyltransferase 1